MIGDSLEALANLDAYNQWIFSLMRHHVHGRVFEIGGGTGSLTAIMAQRADNVVSVEAVETFFNTAAHRFANHPRVTCLHRYLQDHPLPTDETQRFDVAISFNVIEHIEDDVAAHRQMAAMLRPGGKVITFVPAGPRAYGQLDEALGHYRRYTLGSLKQTMEAAGLRWIEGRYSNRIGWFGWWLNSVVLKKTHVPMGQAKSFNRLLPLIKLADVLLPLPFGQSVIGVGEV